MSLLVSGRAAEFIVDAETRKDQVLRDGTGTGMAEVSAALLEVDMAGDLVPEWHDLAERALEPNPFYGPTMTLAGLRRLPEGAGGRVVAAWRDENGARRLVGILPIVRPRGRHLNPFPVRRAAEFYGTLSTPLLDPQRPAETVQAMFAALERAGIVAVVFPFLRADGPCAEALCEACKLRSAQRIEVGRHERPALSRGLAGAEFARLTIEPKRRRKLERQRRRLEDEGPLVFRVATEPSAIVPALESFLALEGSGWKGRLGTSLSQAAGAADYVREVARELAGAGRFRVATLTLNDRPVAAGIIALAGGRAFYLKITYDEAYAKLSPGILLTLDLSCHLLDDPMIEETDSLAVPDHPLYRGLWLRRVPISSEIISMHPGGGAMFQAALRFELARDELRLRSKPLREKLVDRMKRRGAKREAEQGE